MSSNSRVVVLTPFRSRTWSGDSFIKLISSVFAVADNQPPSKIQTSLSSIRKSSGSSLSKCARPVTPVFESLWEKNHFKLYTLQVTIETTHLRTTIWQVVASSLPKIRMSSPGAITATWKLWSNTCFSRQRLTTHLPLLDIDTRITGLHPSRGPTDHRKRIGFQKLVPATSCWRDCKIFNLVDIFGQKKRILGKNKIAPRKRRSLTDMKPNLYNIYFLYRWFVSEEFPTCQKVVTLAGSPPPQNHLLSAPSCSSVYISEIYITLSKQSENFNDLMTHRTWLSLTLTHQISLQCWYQR